MTERTPSSYRHMLRGMSVFGGVQVFQMIISLLRGKFVAVILGPAGMGLAAIYASMATTIQQFASCGLPLSATREISMAGDSDSSRKVADVVGAVRQALWICGLVGAAVCCVAAPWLSRISFGSDAYTWPYMLLGAMILLQTAASAEMSVLQGLRKVKSLGLASVWGAAAGLAAGVPMYLLWGTDGIVPAMVALAASTYAACRIAARRCPASLEPGNAAVRRRIIRRLLSFGLLLMSAQLIGSLCISLANLFLRSHGSVDDVGYFNAATSICTQYVGMIFTAMAMDYFPRLSSQIAHPTAWQSTVSRQTELVALVTAPLAMLLMLTAPIVVSVLLSARFAVIIPLLRWMSVGLFLQAIAYPLGYVAFAKGNKRLYFCLEGLFGNAVYLLATCGCYLLWGLVGIGISSVIRFGIDVAAYYAVNRRAYGFAYSRRCIATVAPLLAATAIAFAATFIPYAPAMYACVTLIFAATSAYSIVVIRRRLAADKESANC